MVIETKATHVRRLSVRQLSKSFPGVRALSGVDLDVQGGEVVAVIGENGAGKSTLMKILAGVQSPDQGQILWDGHPVSFANTRQAMEQGIVLIHQELNLCDNLNVAENLFLGNYPSRGGLIDFWGMYRLARKSLEKVGLNVSPRLPLSRLSLGQQQMVEIAKALSIDAKILIFDEPTSSLSNPEAEALFRLIQDLKARGVGIVYISHRLSEVMKLADRVVVLRDGQNAGELPRSEVSHERMVKLMIGRDVSKLYVRQKNAIGDEVLRVDNLRTMAWPQHASSFHVRRGELVGIAGLVGAGRSELLRSIFGIDRSLGGTVRVGGQSLSLGSPQAAMNAGLGFVPEDRKKEGLVLESSVARNVGLAGLARNAFWGGWLNGRQELADTRQAMTDMRIKTPSPWQLVKFLSGGNQQKVVMGKWLALSPKVLLMDEPTRGVDIGAKQEIYQLMENLAAQGRGVLFVSSELEEIIGIADRVLVMHEGRLAGEVSGDQITEHAIMQLATGGSL
ncbi:MAG: sugar ABC transporter ATP-binding protein [Planctomycetaceae bacterium]|nr:sugar ABC transporter ATP-binding protein [Planctomycetaceae bacterium]